jgi:hypothetical protein
VGSRVGDLVTLACHETSIDRQRRDRKEITVKTMTCRDLGGPCGLAHEGESADDVIKAQDQHLKDAEKAGDASHRAARDAMKNRWRHPKKSMDWYRATKEAFAALPDR